MLTRLNDSTDIIVTNKNLETIVSEIASETIFPDIHTHLFTPSADGLWLSGIIELLRYHYAYREHLGWRRDIAIDTFWKLSEREQADQVWYTHFVKKGDSSVLPVSEGMRAILTILQAFGLDPNAVTLDDAVQFFSEQDPYAHTSKVLELAGVSTVIGTNNPFDKAELKFYRSGREWHPAFRSALRLDDLVLNYKDACLVLKNVLDYEDVSSDLNRSSLLQMRQFLSDWIVGRPQKSSRLPNVSYVGISFPPDFPWLETSDPRVRILEEVVIPSCAEYGISLFLMPEPVRGLEPAMRNAGDYLGKMDSVSFGRFAQKHSEVDIWVSPLNFSSQYEMSALSCVLPHVKPWSTWWYNHQPGLTKQLLDMRIEMNGSNSFLFNSDARVLEHLISKWRHFRAELTVVLHTQVSRLIDTGYEVSKRDISNWVNTMFDERRLSRDSWHDVLQKEYESC